MLANLFLPDVETVELEAITTEDESIVLQLRSVANEVPCPICQQQSQRVHSRFVRRPFDLAWAGISVRLQLHVRRFKCDQLECPQTIFVERLPQLVAPYARRTVRLVSTLLELAVATGGEGGARLSVRLGLGTSPDSLLRIIRRAALPAATKPRAVGVDEWAFRKGRQYGSIVVDLESHEIVELLPDDRRETVVHWLKTHPEVEIISRDRWGAICSRCRGRCPASRAGGRPLPLDPKRRRCAQTGL